MFCGKHRTSKRDEEQAKEADRKQVEQTRRDLDEIEIKKQWQDGWSRARQNANDFMDYKKRDQ